MDDSQCQLAAERVVLSTTFATRNLRMLRVLDARDFTDPLHKLLLKAMKELRQRDAPARCCPTGTAGILEPG